MKKIIFVFMACVAMTFAACGNKCSDTCVNDSVATDTTVVDSMVVDTTVCCD